MEFGFKERCSGAYAGKEFLCALQVDFSITALSIMKLPLIYIILYMFSWREGSRIAIEERFY